MTISRIGKLLPFAAVCVLPLAAAAQPLPAGSADAAYCEKLTKLYRTYINNPEDPRPTQVSPTAEFEVAIAKCHAGDTAAGIPPLEKALRNARINLPARG